ncbi:hypothetical protein MKK75_26560 [Methylobacterium sp. J-030]|uniref:hypothetical protein n=1 Tax=Methylobacterium sp. J-030 TaxID=2836627 RepID=UPI001FB96283|nr:hypothetical protein [Methylobacterium sp. J-030]MCJ2072312.1 hypothetical protein [Methylobacterium sp. J-030]
MKLAQFWGRLKPGQSIFGYKTDHLSISIEDAEVILLRSAEGGRTISPDIVIPIQAALDANRSNSLTPEHVAAFQAAYASLMKQAYDISVKSIALSRDTFEDIIDDAEVLVKYASETGIAVPASDLTNIFAARDELQTGSFDISTKSNFYASYSVVTKLLGDVTANTIRNCSSESTRAILRRNRVWAISITVIATTISLLTFVLDSTSSKIKEDIDSASSLAAKLRLSFPGGTNSFAVNPCAEIYKIVALPNGVHISEDDIQLLQSLSSKIREIHNRSIKLNITMRSVECDPIPSCSQNTDYLRAKRHKDRKYLTEVQPKNEMDSRAQLEINPAISNYAADSLCKIRTLQEVRSFAENVRDNYGALYGGISSYALPILYAVLGAFAYRLRTFSETIRRRTYHPSFSDSARMITAVIAGAISGMVNPAHSLSLSPLATAFLVGYGVEIFFKFLDSLVNAFGTSSK